MTTVGITDKSRLYYKERVLVPPKAKIAPQFGSRTALTNEPWTFVAMWLTRNRKQSALAYWEQARSFHKAAANLPLRASPLLHYYAYMNAAKALLSAKGVKFDERHGVSPAKDPPYNSNVNTLARLGVKIQADGVLPALSSYLQETDKGKTYSIQDMLFNLPYVHRTYCLSVPSQQEMFVPLRECRYVFDRSSKKTHFCGDVGNQMRLSRIARRFPATICASPSDGPRAIRSIAGVPVRGPHRVSLGALDQIKDLHRSLREDIYYINGTQTLWYLKLKTAGQKYISRQAVTLTLAAMHRLSEICRYQPHRLEKLLATQKNWLVTEFIQMSPLQYFDEIAAEMTGQNVLMPNVRPSS